jgi:hypothetical protein
MNKFDGACPHCRKLITVDVAAQEITAKPAAESFDETLQKLSTEKAKRKEQFDAIQQSLSAKKKESDDKFKKNLSKVKHEGLGEKPIRDIDL